MLLFIITPEHESAKLLQCFNTSHVVIYLLLCILIHILSETFQYISCCDLSYVVIDALGGKSRFQYISCCYLSGAVIGAEAKETRFNTSHVVIYLSWRSES